MARWKESRSKTIKPEVKGDSKEEKFLIDLLKGNLGQVIVETIFQKFGYEVYPYGYESYFTNIIKNMIKKGSNKSVRKIRSTPDLFIYDRDENNGYFIEVKTTAGNEKKWTINKGRLHRYLRFWREAVIVVYCWQTHNIYCCPLSEISEIYREKSNRGKTWYEFDLTKDFKTLPDFFHRIDNEGYREFRQKILKDVIRIVGQQVTLPMHTISRVCAHKGRMTGT